MSPQSIGDWLTLGLFAFISIRFAVWFLDYTHAYWLMSRGPERDRKLKRLTGRR